MLTVTQHSGRDYVAEVRCDLGELAEDTKSKKRYCEVELILNIGKFDVKCCQFLRSKSHITRLLIKGVSIIGSPAGENRKLVGKYREEFGRTLNLN